MSCIQFRPDICHGFRAKRGQIKLDISKGYAHIAKPFIEQRCLAIFREYNTNPSDVVKYVEQVATPEYATKRGAQLCFIEDDAIAKKIAQNSSNVNDAKDMLRYCPYQYKLLNGSLGCFASAKASGLETTHSDTPANAENDTLVNTPHDDTRTSSVDEAPARHTAPTGACSNASMGAQCATSTSGPGDMPTSPCNVMMASERHDRTSTNARISKMYIITARHIFQRNAKETPQDFRGHINGNIFCKFSTDMLVISKQASGMLGGHS